MVLSRLSWALRFRQAMYRRIMLACLVLGAVTLLGAFLDN